MNLTLALTSGWFLCVIVKIMVMSIDDAEFCVSEVLILSFDVQRMV